MPRLPRLLCVRLRRRLGLDYLDTCQAMLKLEPKDQLVTRPQAKQGHLDQQTWHTRVPNTRIILHHWLACPLYQVTD